VDGQKTLEIELGSEKFLPLLGDSTFKAAHGGRAGMKSYFFADMHIARALNGGYRALCLREVQKSIKESSKRLLEKRIQHYGLGEHFEVQDQVIKAPNGGLFVFHGLQNHTAESVKSFEGFDVADIEEGQTLSQRSIDLLIPTIIRKKGAQIWARWNPRHETDPIDIMFRGKYPPPDCAVVEVGYKDNPWLSDEIKRQIEADYIADPEKAEHIWGGGYNIITEGAYFAKLIAEAEKAGRIGEFPYDPALPVKTSWDIGVDDYSAAWFWQENGKQARVIDYYEWSGEGAPQLVADSMPELVSPDSEMFHAITPRPMPFRYAQHFFPHDVKVREWGGGARSRLQTLQSLGLKNIHVGAAQGPAERIAASRRLLPYTYFDNNENVKQGLQRLRRYSRKFNTTLQTYGSPLHDENSHGADGFGEFAVNCRIAKIEIRKPEPQRDRYQKLFDKQDNGGASWKTV
jgi:phage terminase large subunit